MPTVQIRTNAGAPFIYAANTFSRSIVPRKNLGSCCEIPSTILVHQCYHIMNKVHRFDHFHELLSCGMNHELWHELLTCGMNRARNFNFSMNLACTFIYCINMARTSYFWHEHAKYFFDLT